MHLLSTDHLIVQTQDLGEKKKHPERNKPVRKKTIHKGQNPKQAKKRDNNHNHSKFNNPLAEALIKSGLK